MYENTCYKTPFLKEVIMRFDFPTPIPDFEKGLPKKFVNLVLKKFPIFEPQTVQTHEMQLGDNEVKSKLTEVTNSVFHGLEKEKLLTIAPTSFVVQFKSYKSFEVFLEESTSPLRLLCELFPEMKASRVGIRYINILDVGNKNPLDWSDYVNPKLLSVIDFYEKSNLSRAFQILEYNFDEDSLKFQTGIANPDYPAKIKQRQFVMDIDSYSVGAYDFQEMIAKIKVGHDRIQNIFESSITNATRTAMKEVKNDGN